MRGELRFSPPHLTLAVCQEPRYLSFLLLVGLVILKSCLLSHYFEGERTSVILQDWTESIHRSQDQIS